jgi:hypothetical protein
MQSRVGIVTVLCVTAVLFAGCASRRPKPEDPALSNRASATGAIVPAAQTASRRHTQEELASLPQDVDRLKRVEAFRDYGRYYK